MNIIIHIIHVLFPLIAIILAVYGIMKKNNLFVTSALWLSILALVLHYQMSGGELLGSYFDYTNAAIYSANLIILIATLLYLLSLPEIKNKILYVANSLFKASLVIASFIVITNLWINAYFIETRMAGTPLMQVANLNSKAQCKHDYVIYKIAKNGSIHYLCPNQYGLFPGIGKLSLFPEFIAQQLSRPMLKVLLEHQQKTN